MNIKFFTCLLAICSSYLRAVWGT